MPLVNVKLIEGVFNESQKREMVRKLTDTMVEIEGERVLAASCHRTPRVGTGELAAIPSRRPTSKRSLQGSRSANATVKG